MVEEEEEEVGMYLYVAQTASHQRALFLFLSLSSLLFFPIRSDFFFRTAG